MNIVTKECASQLIVGFLLDHHSGTFNQLSNFCYTAFKHIDNNIIDVNYLVDGGLEFMITKFKIIKLDDIFILTIRRPYKISPCRYYPSHCSAEDCDFVHTIGEHKIANYLEHNIEYFRGFFTTLEIPSKDEFSLFSRPIGKDNENIKLLKKNFELRREIERLKKALANMQQQIITAKSTQKIAEQVITFYANHDEPATKLTSNFTDIWDNNK